MHECMIHTMAMLPVFLYFSLGTKIGASVRTNDMRDAHLRQAAHLQLLAQMTPNLPQVVLARASGRFISIAKIRLCIWILGCVAYFLIEQNMMLIPCYSRAMHTLQDGSGCIWCWSIVSNKWWTQKCLAAVAINHLGPDPANMHEFNVTTMSNPLDLKLD